MHVICFAAGVFVWLPFAIYRWGSTLVKSAAISWHSHYGRLIDSTKWEWCLEMVCVHRFGVSSNNGLVLKELENSMVPQKAMLMLVSTDSKIFHTWQVLLVFCSLAIIKSYSVKITTKNGKQITRYLILFWYFCFSCFVKYNIPLCHWRLSVLWRCWLGGRKDIRPVKTEWWDTGVVICLERGADLHMAQLMPLPLTVSCSSKIQIGFTFHVPAYPGCPGKQAVKWL